MTVEQARRWTLALFILLFPFYVFRKGIPQPSHWLIAFAIVLSVPQFVRMFRTSDRDVLLPLLLFAIYTVFINGYLSIAYPPDTFFFDLPLRHSLYYFFNFCVFAVFLLQLREGGLRDVRLYAGCFLAALIALGIVSIWLPPDDSGRLIGGFNNPNQLGYYGLTCLVIGVAFAARFRVGVVLFTAFGLAALYLIARSLSVAAIGSVLLLFGLFAVFGPGSRRTVAMALGLAVASITIVALLIPGAGLLEGLKHRSERISDQIHVYPTQRKTERLFYYPQYLAFGAGEGAITERFNSGDEVHSTLGTVVFSYGVPGTLLFGWFLVNLVRKDVRTSLLLLIPLLVFGLAHNGLRFSTFWIALCFIYVTAGLRAQAEDVPPLTFLPEGLRPAWIRSR